ncbi:glycosyltransferase family 4 protein [Streptomyces sp. NBC_01433]|uniref:glycosyltransferase family 4 protein n=1 Tax=Streptomyces sp. NBC_01433 TaxID=2903864 RepID=UPI00224EFEF4|nr:glycosyltransferase family 4 protein [Streptomyces sp. NBC_01433]MCX4681005.1 glycosyltransferase family 4 protein [Streptomyces sp. NBC_01433]
MRISYLHGGSIPSLFANGVHVMRMCDAFAAAGHDVTLYSMPGSDPAEDPYTYYGVSNHFPIRLVPAPDHTPSGYWRRADTIRHMVARGPLPDIVYGRDPYALSVLSDLAPFVYEVHQLRKDLVPVGTERKLLGKPGLARVVTITHALAGDLRKKYEDLGTLPILVAPDCADPPGPNATTEAPQLPGRPDVPRVGYVGHLYDGRGIGLVLDLADRFPGLDFHLVGGTAEDRARWEKTCRASHVYFHGHRPPSTLPAYYGLFDIVLAPYETKVYTWGRLDETGRWASPMKVFEYMSHGLPMIASDLPVLREVLQDRVNCLLRPPEDPAAWAEALGELVADGALRRSLGDEARRQVLERYTWRRRADDVLADIGPPARPGTGETGLPK